MTLRYKLQALTAPCREVDAEIAKAFDFYEHEIGKRHVRLSDGTWRSETWRPVPKFTASLDAAVELVERELPEAEVSLNIYGMSFAMVYNGGGPSKEVEHHHTLPAVAVLLALLDAKEIE